VPEHRAGLRARKKARMRQHISDVATALFVEHGFEAVTVAEVAQAADVAENTVFNYFPTKEDLFFDRAAEIEARFSRIVGERAPGESVVAALRRDFIARLDACDESLGLSPTIAAFWRVVDASPSLQARLLAIGQRAVAALARTLAAEAGLPADDPGVRLVAQLAAAVPFALQDEIRRHLRAGQAPERVARALRPVAEAAFDLLEGGLGDYGAARPEPS
jgi:AcrR family transcriptional regulator